MDTVVETKCSAKDLNLRIQQHINELAQATDEARSSKVMLRYLDFCSRFHEYSHGNILLIMLSRPGATFVAGFHRWVTLNRFVRKGERGIPILAPVLVKEEEKDGLELRRLVGFKVVYVFDVAQTDGEPLPLPPDWKSPEKNEELNCRLLQFAKNHGISVTFKDLPGELQGISKGGSIEISLTAGTKTLCHEITHARIHTGKNNLQNRAIKELEAEGVSWVVCRHFGLENLNCPTYIALHGLKSQEIFAHMERIRNIANEIITAIDPHS